MKIKILFSIILVLLLYPVFSINEVQNNKLQFSKAKPISDLKIEGISSIPFFSFYKSKEIRFTLNLSKVKLYEVENYDYIKVADLKPFTKPGEPQLPMKTFVIKFPLNVKIKDVKVVSGSYVEILNELNIVPMPEPIRWGEKSLPEYKPDKKVYSLDSYFPGKIIKYEIGKDNQYQYVYIRIFPLQYIPSQKKAILITEATIMVYYSDEDFFRESYDIGSYGSDSSNDISAVIITPLELYQQALELAEFHNNTGINTIVVNTSWIWDNSEEAQDPPYDGYNTPSLPGWSNIKNYNYSLAKKIINYLNTTAKEQGIEYVILFGNARLIPPSYYVYIPHYDTYNNWIPTDFFYASPDYDFTPNYMIGRLPINSPEEAQHVVNKIKSWHGNLTKEWFRNVVLVGGRAPPLPSEYFIGEALTTIVINKGYLEGMNISKLYRTDDKFNKDDIMNALSGNTGIIYVVTHGSGDCWSIEGRGSYVCVNDLLSLSFNPNLSVVVSIACMNGAFDTHLLSNPYHYTDTQISFGEAILLSNAGGIAYIGGSRVNYGCVGGYFEKGYFYPDLECFMQAMLTYFFEAYHNGSLTLGNMTKLAMEKYLERRGLSFIIDNVTFFAFTLLGDPVLSLPRVTQPTTYQQPNLTAINPEGYTHASNFIQRATGEIPFYNLDENEAIKINLTSSSSKIKVKLINVNRIYKETVETKEISEKEYFFIPSENALYLIRAISSDGKEGWLYTYAQILPSKVNLYLSAPVIVKAGDFVYIKGNVEPPLVINFTTTLIFPNGTKKNLGTVTSNQMGYFFLFLPTFGYPSGKYEVIFQGKIESLSVEGSITFKIADYDKLEIFLLTSKNFNETQCKQYGFKSCKVWAINTSEIIDHTNCNNSCKIVNLSRSGKVHIATINTSKGERYIAVVDTSKIWNGSAWIPVYDTVFIDDDPVFMESPTEESNLPEKGFLTEGDIVESIETVEGEKVNIKIAKIARDGNSILLITPPTSDEIPYEINDWVSFIVLALKEGNPKSGIEIYPKYFYEDSSPYDYSNLQKSITDEFGLSQIYSFPVYKTGFYRIEVNNEHSIVIKVKAPFDVRYVIKDAETGKEKSLFKPGDKIKFEVFAVDKKTGMLIPLKNVFVNLIDPEWNWHIITLKDNDGDYIYEGTYSLNSNAPAGIWHVEIKIESEEGIKEHIKTVFEVKTFEVKTFSPEKFAPNNFAWILVTAIPIGYSQYYYNIPEFYPIDDPNTTIDECSYINVIIDWVKDKEGNEINVSNWEITNVERFLRKVIDSQDQINSKYLQRFKQYAEELSDNFLRQCVIQFNAPNKTSIYTGNLYVKRADTNEWEKGGFTFYVQTIDAWAYPWDPEEAMKWKFSPGENVTLKIRALNLYNYEEISPEDIIDVKVIEIIGKQGSVDILNQSFVKTADYALLTFRAPNQTGWYEVKFILTAQINHSGEIRNRTGLGRGWFIVKLYDVWGRGERIYESNESVAIRINVRDVSGNPVSNIRVEIEEIRNLKTREEYTNKASWQPNITNSNGETIIILTPNTSWTKGFYDVKLKAIDSEGRYEYGWAGFEVKNYIVWIKVVGNEGNVWKITKGDTITLIPLVWRISQKWSEKPLSKNEYLINLEESVLNYYGNTLYYRYEPEKIKFTNLNVTLWEINYENISLRAVNISTSSLKPGNYKASIKLDIKGEEEIGWGLFRIITFTPYARVLQNIYAPGDTVSINVSVSSAQSFNVTLKQLVICSEWKCSKVDINTTPIECDNSCLYNFSLPTNIEEGWCSGNLEFKIGEDVEYEWVTFKIKSLNIAPPKSAIISLWKELTNKTYVYDYTTLQSTCSEIKEKYNLTLPLEISNHSCTLLNSTLIEDGYLQIPRTKYLILIDTSEERIYIDTDTDFTNGTIAYNLTINDNFTDNEGIEWVIKSIDDNGIELEAKNALSNGIKINLTLSKSGRFRFGWFNETLFGEYEWETQTDLNNNGKLENIYLLAVDSNEPGVYDRIFVEYNITDLSNKTPIPVGSTTTALGTPIYVIELTKTAVGGLIAYLATPEVGNYYPWFGVRKINTNITFPVLVTYPNGSAVQGANVSIYKIILRTGSEAEELNYSAITQTDSNGIAIFMYNLTKPCYYTIIPKAQVGDKQVIMERWIAPHVKAKAFHAYGNTYSKLIEIKDWEIQIPIKLETTFFPREGIEVSLDSSCSDITPPNEVTEYYCGSTFIGENEWLFLIDNKTERIYIDNDIFFNDTDYGWQNISIGKEFWLNWTDWSGRKYNVTFKLLDRPQENIIIFGFELGKYSGMNIILDREESKTVVLNNKSYTLVYNGNYSLKVIDYQGFENEIEVDENQWYYIYPLNIYIQKITETSINLSLSIGDLRITNYTHNGYSYTIIILDDHNYSNSFDLEKYREVSYDTLLILQTGNLSEGVEFHPGNYIQLIGNNIYLSKIHSDGFEVLFLNGTIPILYPPETESNYLVKNISEAGLGIDLNEDGDMDDNFYFVIYDYFGETKMIIDDDNDLLREWICSEDCYAIDFRDSEIGEKEECINLPNDNVWLLNSRVLFNNQTDILVLLRNKYIFGSQENITILVEAYDFDWAPIEGNLSIIKIKTWNKEITPKNQLVSTLINGYGLITITPQDFNLTSWYSDFRIIGKITSTDRREETITIWVNTNTSGGKK